MQANQSPMQVAAYTPAPVGARFLAVVIDGIIVALLGALGGVPGIVYALIRDGLFDGRSVGKKVMGLKVINVETGAPCTFVESAVRHVANSVGALVPCAGQLFALYEVFLVLTKDDRRRMGDQWAKTMVVPG